MTSPFPGMDPFLEGIEWHDVHHALAFTIKRQLLPQILPTYFARVERYVVQDTEPQEDLHIFYPDVEVLRKPPDRLEEPAVAYRTASMLTPPTITVPETQTFLIGIPFIEIRDAADNRLITAIEILSPVNKRKPGIESYRKKRRSLHSQGVHLLEIDLLRRGSRLLRHPVVSVAHYLVSLLRGENTESDIWAMSVRDALPVVPVPLASPDADVRLDLQKAMDEVYEESYYQISVSYKGEPPPPAFSEEDWLWMKQLLQPKTPG